ncbi:MAG: MFS transporter, partial [Lysobacter sp.]|nr:MFS transporter [Lysobacter sp.]
MPGEVELNRQVIQPQESTTNAQSPVRARSRSVSCAATSILIGLTQGFGIYLVSSNLSQIQGSLGATGVEALYLTTAYFSSALTATVLLTKFRLHFGLRQFALLGLVSFLIVSLLHLATNSLGTAIAVRIALGVAAAPLSTLAAFYMMEAFPPAHVRTGLLLGFCVLQVGAPLSRVVSPDLLELGRWHGLFLLDVALAILSVAAIHAVPLTPVPTRAAFSRGDVPAFVLYATGMGLLCIVLSLGTSCWWTDAPWLGYGAAGSIALLAAYVVVDFPRENPLLNLRWMVTPYMLRFFF